VAHRGRRADPGDPVRPGHQQQAHDGDDVTRDRAAEGEHGARSDEQPAQRRTDEHLGDDLAREEPCIGTGDVGRLDDERHERDRGRVPEGLLDAQHERGQHQHREREPVDRRERDEDDERRDARDLGHEHDPRAVEPVRQRARHQHDQHRGQGTRDRDPSHQEGLRGQADGDDRDRDADDAVGQVRRRHRRPRPAEVRRKVAEREQAPQGGDATH
jgi:hypothetical protein